MTLKIETKQIVARSRKLKARWSIEVSFNYTLLLNIRGHIKAKKIKEAKSEFYEDLAVYWVEDNELHREDGPAVVMQENDAKAWYQHGKLHREDGPAITDNIGNKGYYLNDNEYNEEDWKQEVRNIKLNSFLGEDDDAN